jgi:5-hydroxyisourate hydrolase-like protein (transthyretin family)
MKRRNRLLKTAVCLFASFGLMLTAVPAEAWADGTQTDSAVFSVSLNAADAGISDGFYSIVSKLSSSSVMETADASLDACGNIDIADSTGASNQVFRVTSLGNGLYTVMNANSRKVLDASNAGTENGTNIQQYDSNGTPAQQWKILDNGDGSCTIQSSYCDKVLDVSNGSTVSGTNVQLYESNSTPAQQWVFTKNSEVTNTSEKIKGGVYTIASSIDAARVLDVATGSYDSRANIQLYGSNGTSAQKFIVSEDGTGYYTIRNFISRKVLDVAGGSKADGANVQQYQANGTAAQKWKITVLSDGTCSIAAACGKFLDAAGGSSEPGTNIQIYSGNGSAAQKWELIPAEVPEPSGGMVQLLSSLDDTKVIDAAGGSWDNGTNIQIYAGTESASKTNQQFVLQPLGDGWFTIMNVNTGKVLDVAGGTAADGTNVQLYEPNGTEAQQWKFVSSGDGDGSYSIVSRLGLNLDVSGGYSNSGTNVQIYTGNGTAAQKFYVMGTNFNGSGWYSAAHLSRSYYTNGSALTGWQKIGCYWYHFNDSGMMDYSTVVGTNRLQDNGRMATLSTVFEDVQPGGKTIKNLLQNAMLACGRTLYIWGGGWDSSDTQKIGYYPSWENFFLANGDASYNRHNYEYSYGSGVDCSGFMAWAIYNTVYTTNGQINLLEEDGNYYNSTLMASRLANLQWAYLGKAASTSSLESGDIVSMSGHVWMVIGVCDDGSVVLVHSSPAGSAYGGGVQISGTINDAGSSDSQAYRLAKQYMNKYFFEWPFPTASVGSAYLQYNNFAEWNTRGGVLTDPDGYQKMSAEAILKDLFKE